MTTAWSPKYTVEATDDLNSRKVVVRDEHGRLAYRKMRELVGEEVVESLIDANGQVVWTIHRPLRGYYLLLRSPLLSHIPSSFVSLRPASSDRFTFSLDPSNVPSVPPSSSSSGRGAHGRSGSVSSPNLDGLQRRSVHPASPRFPLRIQVNGHANPAPEDEEDMPTPTAARAPQSLPTPPAALSFEVAPVPSAPVGVLGRLTGLFTDPPVSFSCSLSSSSTTRSANGRPPQSTTASPALSIVSSASLLPSSSSTEDSHPQIFTYTDASSRFRLRSTGTLSIADEAAPGFASGLGSAFWVAVALAYLEYREDKEAYLAASEDVE